MAWGWRTKPRSVIKTIQWFKSFEKLEGEDWDYSLKKLSKKEDGTVLDRLLVVHSLFIL